MSPSRILSIRRHRRERPRERQRVHGVARGDRDGGTRGEGYPAEARGVISFAATRPQRRRKSEAEHRRGDPSGWRLREGAAEVGGEWTAGRRCEGPCAPARATDSREERAAEPEATGVESRGGPDAPQPVGHTPRPTRGTRRWWWRVGVEVGEACGGEDGLVGKMTPQMANARARREETAAPVVTGDPGRGVGGVEVAAVAAVLRRESRTGITARPPSADRDDTPRC